MVDLSNVTGAKGTTHGCMHGKTGSKDPTTSVNDGSIHVRFKDENAKGHFVWKVVGKTNGFTANADVCQVPPGKHVLSIKASDKDWVLLSDSLGRNGLRETSQIIPVVAHTTTVVTIEHVSRQYVQQDDNPEIVTVADPRREVPHENSADDDASTNAGSSNSA